MHAFADPTTQRIAAFLRGIGIEVVPAVLEGPTFLPGIAIDGARLRVDEARLSFPGDLLHEAGHLAIRPAAERVVPAGELEADLGEEMAAIAWSYAALRHLGLEPEVVFHAEGYRGASTGFIDNFAAGRYVAVPLLQWMGMCVDEKNASAAGVEPYPRMVRWLRE
jgi:hypothetical protein